MTAVQPTLEEIEFINRAEKQENICKRHMRQADTGSKVTLNDILKDHINQHLTPLRNKILMKVTINI